jgi:hypothetical protein
MRNLDFFFNGYSEKDYLLPPWPGYHQSTNLLPIITEQKNHQRIGREHIQVVLKQLNEQHLELTKPIV